MKKLVSLAFCFLLTSSIFGQTFNPLGKMVHHDYPSLNNPFATDEMVFFKNESDETKLVKATPKGKPSFYWLEHIYTGSDWRFMKGPYLIKAGEELFEIKIDSPSHDVISGGVMESLMGNITIDMIKAMASSDEVQIQWQYSPATIDPDGLVALKKFYAFVTK